MHSWREFMGAGWLWWTRGGRELLGRRALLDAGRVGLVGQVRGKGKRKAASGRMPPETSGCLRTEFLEKVFFIS